MRPSGMAGAPGKVIVAWPEPLSGSASVAPLLRRSDASAAVTGSAMERSTGTKWSPGA